MQIRCAESDCILEIDEITRDPRTKGVDSFRVRVSGSGVSATARVYGGLTCDLGEFFSELADHWQGWYGAKMVESPDGEFRLTATNDARGHIELELRLLRSPMPGRWELVLPFHIEAGQLDALAAEVGSGFAMA